MGGRSSVGSRTVVRGCAYRHRVRDLPAGSRRRRQYSATDGERAAGARSARRAADGARFGRSGVTAPILLSRLAVRASTPEPWRFGVSAAFGGSASVSSDLLERLRVGNRETARERCASVGVVLGLYGLCVGVHDRPADREPDPRRFLRKLTNGSNTRSNWSLDIPPPRSDTASSTKPHHRHIGARSQLSPRTPASHALLPRWFVSAL